MAKSVQQIERDVVRLRDKIRSYRRPLTPEEQKQIEVEAAALRAEAGDALTRGIHANRPEVISRGKPQATKAVRCGMNEARARLSKRSEFIRACSNCPAATVNRRIDGVVTVRCGVELSLLTSEKDPQSLLSFCLGGDHTSCPSWIAEKERVWANKRPLVEA